MTAAHCFSGRLGTWSTHFADGSSHDIGAVWSYVAPPTGDAGLLAINNPSGWGLPARRIRIQAVFADHTAYGIHHGAYSSCDTIFYDMGYAKLWLGVDPAN